MYSEKTIISKKFQNGTWITREIKLLKRKEYRLYKYFKRKRSQASRQKLYQMSQNVTTKNEIC